MLLDALNDQGYVCASCDISPEFREFERASTTVINGYVGPLMVGWIKQSTGDFGLGLLALWKTMLLPLSSGHGERSRSGIIIASFCL